MEERKDLLYDNIFINKAWKLYTDVSTGKATVEVDVEEEKLIHITANIYRRKVTTVKKEVPIVEEYNKHVKSSLAIHPLIFSNMWQFCQFVRWAEKVVFYKNSANRRIYVDSAIDDYDTRLLVYTENDFQIKFKLEKVANPAYIPNTLSDVLSMKSDTPKYFKSMKIVVERNYGKNMTNHFTIIDDKHDFNNDMSNTLLYETIDRNLSEAVELVIKEIFNLIYINYKFE